MLEKVGDEHDPVSDSSYHLACSGGQIICDNSSELIIRSFHGLVVKLLGLLTRGCESDCSFSSLLDDN